MGKDGARDQTPGPPPTEEYSEFKPVAVGIGLWVILLVLALLFRHDLESDGHGWWLWTAVAGIGEGFLGYFYLYRRAARNTARNAAVSEPDYRTPGRP